MYDRSPRDETRSERHQHKRRISEYSDSSASSPSSCHQRRRVQPEQRPRLPSYKRHRAKETVCAFNTPKRRRTRSPMEARFTSRHNLRRRAPLPYRRNEKRQRAPRNRFGHSFYCRKLDLGVYQISGWPDILTFLISGIRPDIRFRLPDIRLEKAFQLKTAYK